MAKRDPASRVTERFLGLRDDQSAREVVREQPG